MDPKAARYVNAGIGVWLFISAFLWPHTSAQYANTWIMAIVTFVIALVAIGTPGFRFLNTVAGAWLIISAFVLPTISAATRWNNFIVGVVVLILSLYGTSPSSVSVRRTRTA
jgi:hypothetical protein